MAYETENIRFRDLVEREENERLRLKQRRDTLDLIEKDKKRVLTKEEVADLQRLKDINDRVEKAPQLESVDPLYVAVRELFNATPGLLGKILLNPDRQGKLHFRAVAAKAPAPAGGVAPAVAARAVVARKKAPAPAGGVAPAVAAPPAPAAAKPADSDLVVRAALTIGRMIAKKAVPPRVVHRATNAKGDIEIRSDRNDPDWTSFSEGFFDAFGWVQGRFELARLVLPLLAEEGDSDRTNGNPASVRTEEFARVIDCLVGKGITAKEPQLSRRVNECLDTIQAVGDRRPLSETGIDLPDLEEVTDLRIQAEHVKLMGPMIAAAMFEELKAFQVLDKLVEMFQSGVLTVGRGKAGQMLYDYWKATPNRMREDERRNFYELTIGIPGGYANGMANRDFNDLWMRFVSSVSSLVRQAQVDNLLRSPVPGAISQQQVRKAARDLAANLSLHGYGMAFFAAVELQNQIKDMIKLLGDDEIKGAFGARDMWQVIDQVATMELGGARNSSRYRTLATCGAIITAWLADNVEKYTRQFGDVISMDVVRTPSPRTSGKSATQEPTDFDLVNACELWLADTAVSDDRVEQLAQPRESPVMTSKPIQVPSFAREMLEQAGIPGFGLGVSANRR